MKAPVLYVVGTPGGRWAEWARAWLAGTPYARSFELAAAARARVARSIDEDRIDRGQPAFESGELGGWLPDPAAIGPDGGVFDDGCWAIDPLIARLPSAVFVGLIESPAAGLAAALAAGDAVDPASWLAHWRAGGRRLLRMVQSHRSRCLLLDADEARRDPDAAWALLGSQLGVAPGMVPSSPEMTAPDTLSVAIASLLADSRPEVHALHRELIASCEVLTAEGEPATAGPSGPAIDGAAVVRDFIALRQSGQGMADAARQAGLEQVAALQRQAADLAAALTERDTQLQRAQQAIDAAAGDAVAAQTRSLELQQAVDEGRLALEPLHQELARLRAEMQDTAQRGEQLQQALLEKATLQAASDEQIRQLAQGLEQAAAASQAAEVERRELDATLQTTRQNAEWLSGKVKRTQAAHQQLKAETEERDATLQAERLQLTQALDRAVAAQAVADAENEVLRLHAASSQQDVESLLTQLHDAQEALEDCDLRRRKAEAGRSLALPATVVAPDAAAAAPMVPTQAPRVAASDSVIGDSKILSSRHEPPYSEVTFSLRRIQGYKREIGEATVRLVEHHGHPGLAIFSSKGMPRLVQSWRETGQEDGRPYMLLVPSDAAGQAAFAAMGSDDWQLLLLVVSRLENDLRATSDVARKRWAGLAARLREQLLELPHRFRFGSLNVESIDGPAGAGFAYRFNRVLWGARELRQLAVQWHPAGADAGVVLLGADRDPPLLSWPDDETGQPPGRLKVPLGRRASADDRQRWHRLPAADRDFIVAMLSIWPDAATLTPAELLAPSGIGSTALAAAAAVVKREAEQTLAPMSTLLGSAKLGVLIRRAARHLQQRRAADT